MTDLFSDWDDDPEEFPELLDDWYDEGEEDCE